MSKSNAFDAPIGVLAPHSTFDVLMKFYSELRQDGATHSDVAGILTIGSEATLFRTVQRAFRGPQWTITHAGNLHDAMATLRLNVTAVAITESEVGGTNWRDIIAQLEAVPDAPEVIIMASDKSIYGEVVELGGYDVLERSIETADLQWTVASAWRHCAWRHWMKRHEDVRLGGGLCSDA